MKRRRTHLSRKNTQTQLAAERDKMTLLATRVARQGLARALGQSYDGERDIYDALGWKKTLRFEDYYDRWRRDGIAKKIVSAFPSATWRGRPSITYEGDSTEFADKWTELVRSQKLWHYFARADKLAGIGCYGALLMGFSGNGKLSDPVTKAGKLIYLRPLAEGSCRIEKYETDAGSERFGKPVLYSVILSNNTMMSGDSHFAPSNTRQLVHWTRIIHIAEGLEEDDLFGEPRLESVFNYLYGLELITGASPEMYWRGAFPGMSFAAQEGAEFDPTEEDNLIDEIEEYMHDLKRYLKIQGLDVKQFAIKVADPTHHFKMLIELIAGAKGYPQRILLGSEEGKLASVQDENNWANRVDERRREFAEPVILRPFVDRMMLFGILPKLDSYEVEWPAPAALAETTRAEIAEKRANAIRSYMTSEGPMILPPFYFFRDLLGYSEQEAREIEKLMASQLDEPFDDDFDDEDSTKDGDDNNVPPA